MEAHVDAHLEVRGLVKKYGARTVVNAVDLDLSQGEIVGLLGPNGAGKSTIFKMIIGSIRANAGSIRLGEEELSNKSIDKIAQSGIGYLAQEPTIFRGMTVRQNIRIPFEIRRIPRRERERQVRDLAEEFSLVSFLDRRADQLSGGERRRVEIARLLATNPKLMLFDEPFTGIDPITIVELQEQIRLLCRRNIGILLTDHQVRETLVLCHRAYIINEGNFIAKGGPAEIVKDETVRKLYLGQDFKL